MSILYKILWLFFLIILSFVSFVLGAKFGIEQNEGLQSAVRANVIVGELNALRSGKINEVIKKREMDLDIEVANYGNYSASGYPWLFFWVDDVFDQDRYLNSIANYRRIFPSVLGSIPPKDMVDEKIREDVTLIKETTDLIIRKYGSNIE